MEGSWLIYLICPLMMLPMIYMLFKGNHGGQDKQDHQKRLVEELNALKRDNEKIQNELRELKRDA